jgi:uncharacterized protein (DUF1330 family)
MSAYFVLTQTVTDLQKYTQQYSSEQAIRDLLADPDYQPLKKLRMSITKNGNAVVAPEFKMPS